MHTPDIRPVTPPLPLRKTHDAATYRRNKRLVAKRDLSEPIHGYFIDAPLWQTLPLEQKRLVVIYALAYEHPYWPVASFSAALLLGASLPDYLIEHVCDRVYFTTDQNTHMRPRKTLPVDFVFLQDSHDYIQINEAFAAWHPHSDSIFTRGKTAARLYNPITENLGVLNGIITTSPLETIFTIMCSGAPYGQCLSACDEIARLYGITTDDLAHFMDTKAYCWSHQLALFKLSHVDPRSENGGESLARARMILEGFEDPTLQTVIPNPLYDPKLPKSDTHRRHNTQTLRPDFLWLLNEKGQVVHEPITVPLPSGYRCVIAEMDGFEKYNNTAMLSRSNARDSKDAWYQEKDRDVALQILGFTIIHFSYDDVTENNGKRLCDLLDLAQIPHISGHEKRHRIHLAEKFGDFSILPSELRRAYLQSSKEPSR